MYTQGCFHMYARVPQRNHISFWTLCKRVYFLPVFCAWIFFLVFTTRKTTKVTGANSCWSNSIEHHHGSGVQSNRQKVSLRSSVFSLFLSLYNLSLFSVCLISFLLMYLGAMHLFMFCIIYYTAHHSHSGCDPSIDHLSPQDTAAIASGIANSVKF